MGEGRQELEVSDDDVISAPSDATEPVEVPAPPLSKTPLFQAVHANRYQRQSLVKEIESETGRRLICYVSGDQCMVNREDTVPFVDLLHNVPVGCDLDLLLHTGGGDMDAAEKLISMVRTRVGTGQLRVVIPDFAKSAGTLMALGADLIVMSDTSELGPIDPQIVLADGNGNRISHPVQSYLDAYQDHSEALKKDPSNVVSQIMLNKLDPATIKVFQVAMKRARAVADKLLKEGMLKEEGTYTKVSSDLLDTKKWLSHGQMISWVEAGDGGIGLKIEYLAPDSDPWQRYWQLYCLQRLAIGPREKLYESNYASLKMEGA